MQKLWDRKSANLCEPQLDFVSLIPPSYSDAWRPSLQVCPKHMAQETMRCRESEVCGHSLAFLRPRYQYCLEHSALDRNALESSAGHLQRYSRTDDLVTPSEIGPRRLLDFGLKGGKVYGTARHSIFVREIRF